MHKDSNSKSEINFTLKDKKQEWNGYYKSEMFSAAGTLLHTMGSFMIMNFWLMLFLLCFLHFFKQLIETSSTQVQISAQCADNQAS